MDVGCMPVSIFLLDAFERAGRRPDDSSAWLILAEFMQAIVTTRAEKPIQIPTIAMIKTAMASSSS